MFTAIAPVPIPVPLPVIEYGKMLRYKLIWYACRASSSITSSNGDRRYRPDPQGDSLMYFGDERSLIQTVLAVGLPMEVDSKVLEPFRNTWLKEHVLHDESDI